MSRPFSSFCGQGDALFLNLCGLKTYFVGFPQGHTLESTLKAVHGTNLDVEVHDAVLVHVFQALTGLAHVVDHLRLRHLVVFMGDAVKQLPSRQAAKWTERSVSQQSMHNVMGQLSQTGSSHLERLAWGLMTKP